MKRLMHVPLNDRLCFADCMNNGGTSSLYIDFTPNEAGQVGQVVRYVHDPDSFEVPLRLRIIYSNL